MPQHQTGAHSVGDAAEVSLPARGLSLAGLAGGRHRHLPPRPHPLSLHLPLHPPCPLQGKQEQTQTNGSEGEERPKKSMFTNMKKKSSLEHFLSSSKKNLSLQINQRITLHKKVNYCPSLHFLKRNHQSIFCKEINRKLFPTF